MWSRMSSPFGTCQGILHMSRFITSILRIPIDFLSHEFLFSATTHEGSPFPTSLPVFVINCFILILAILTGVR